MGFKNNYYATVWEIDENGRGVCAARLSTSRKDKEGKYYTDFSGFVKILGDATDIIDDVIDEIDANERARVKILECECNQYQTKSGEYKYTFTIWKWELVEGDLPEKPKTAKNRRTTKAKK